MFNKYKIDLDSWPRLIHNTTVVATVFIKWWPSGIALMFQETPRTYPASSPKWNESVRQKKKRKYLFVGILLYSNFIFQHITTFDFRFIKKIILRIIFIILLHYMSQLKHSPSQKNIAIQGSSEFLPFHRLPQFFLICLLWGSQVFTVSESAYYEVLMFLLFLLTWSIIGSIDTTRISTSTPLKGTWKHWKRIDDLPPTCASNDV